jgi:hypothetical protein
MTWGHSTVPRNRNPTHTRTRHVSSQRQDSRSCQTTSFLPFLLLLLPRNLPYPPKLEILVSRARAHHIARGAHTTEQHARVMRVPDLRDAIRRRIRVDHYRIRRISMSRQQFLLVWRPLNRSHLCRRFQRMQSPSRRAIPNVDRSIVRPAATRQKGRLPWAPRKSLEKGRSVSMKTALDGNESVRKWRN